MNEWMKKEWMLKELERIWPEGKGSNMYKLIETIDEYKEEVVLDSKCCLSSQ